MRCYKELAYVITVMGETKNGRTRVIHLVIVVNRPHRTKEKKGELVSCITWGKR